MCLSGHGSTTVETSDGRKHSFEWGPKSLFALPLNARYQHFNSSGRERARLASTNNLCMMLNLFHNESFVFQNAYEFPERQGAQRFFSGEGDFIPVRPGRNMWETNFIPDLAGFELKEWAQRGAGGSSMMFILADGTMHAHSSQMPVGTYKKAHRHGADFHVFAVTGHGFSLLWYEGEPDFVRVDWQHGVVFAPPDRMFHQHFNTAPDPARYLAVAFGSLRYPFTHRQAQRVPRHGRERQGRRLPDRIRAPGSAHPPHLSQRAGEVRRRSRRWRSSSMKAASPTLRRERAGGGRGDARPRIRASPRRGRRRRASQRDRLVDRQCGADHGRHRHRIVDLAPHVRARAPAAALDVRCRAASSWSSAK